MFYTVQTSFVSCQASYPLGTGDCFSQGIKFQIMKLRGHLCLAGWRIVKHRDNFTIMYVALSMFLFNPLLPEVLINYAHLDSVLTSQKTVLPLQGKDS
jgi:hypothetical protein